MKRKDIMMLVVVALITGIISLLITNVIFSTPKDRGAKVPTVGVMPTALPDVKNDPAYKAFLNSNAIDPTQPVQIGNSQNSTPFNTSAQ